MSYLDLLNHRILTALAPLVIGTDGPYCLGTQIAAASVPAPASGAWPVANRALYVPFFVPAVITVYRLFVVNGTAVSGNLDMGIYNSAGAKIVSIGSTAQAGTQVTQYLNITDTVLQPGAYYFAFVLDNTTGAVYKWEPGTPTNSQIQAWGIAQETSAFPLPATATLATTTAAFFPLMGLSCRASP